MGESTKGLKQKPFYRLRTRITLPFALLTLLVAGVGTFMVVRFIGVSLEDRLTSYVIDAVDVTSQGVVRLQNEQLEALRVMAYTEGVPQATASRDAVELANLLVPLKMNYNLHVVEVIDANGREILGIQHDPSSAKVEDFSLSQEAELSSWPIVSRLIAAGADQIGNRQVEILPSAAGHVLWIGAPIRDGQKTVGCILTGVYLDNVAVELTQVAVARVSLYDRGGRAMASTFFHAPGEVSIQEDVRGKLQADPDSVFLEPLKWEGREYLVGYAPLIVRGNELGTIAAAVNTEHIAESNMKASSGMIALFSAAGLGVLFVGYFIAGRITTPLRSLAETSRRIAAGDFTSRVQRESGDEIGQVARAFNFMAGELEKHTEQLSRRIAELSVLYESSSELNRTLDLAEILKVAVDALGRSEEVSLVLLLHREVSGDWRWAATRGLASLQSDRLLSERLEVLPNGLAPVAWGDKPLVISGMEEIETLKKEIGFDAEVDSLMVVPLASPGQLIGIVLLGTTERSGFSDRAQLNLLQTISTQIARSIQNARLYGQVRENMTRLDALLRVSRSIGEKLSQDEVVESVLSGVEEVSKADVVIVSVWDPVSKRLQLAGANSEVQGQGHGEWLGSEIAMRAVQDACPLAVKDGKIAPASTRNGNSVLGNRLCVPMLVEDQVVGAIFVEAVDSSSGFLPDDLMALTTVSNQAAVAMKNAFLYKDIRELYHNIVRSLAATIDAHDEYTYGHSHRVATNSLILADCLGLGDNERSTVEVGAYLHDVGKIGIPDSILLKKGSLSKDQIKSVEEHPVVGARILEPVGFDEEVISVVLSHHERVDGRGYPSGLKDDAIPLGARILCVADSFDAMVSDRPYRSKLPVEAALRELRAGAGTQFDSVLVEEFVAAYFGGRIVLPGNAASHQPDKTEAEPLLEGA